MIITIFGIAAAVMGIVTALATLLQAQKIAHAHTTGNVSISFHEIRLVQFAILLGFGMATGNVYLIIPNLVGLIVAVITVTVAKHYAHPVAH
jgi:hypothetical protein